MPQCDGIILGGSHDNGYAHLLSKLETANVVPGKVRLLQGPSFAAELDRFGTTTFPRVKFGTLFMETKLESRKTLKYTQVAADGVLPMAPRKSVPSPKATTVVVPAPPNPRKLAQPDYGTMPPAFWLMQVDVYSSVKALTPRPCNSHYLIPHGCTKTECNYSHSHKLSQAQISTLLYYSRQTPCEAFHNRGGCYYGDECIRGHNCPDNVDGTCGNAVCRLSHPITVEEIL
jgi:hypothetical protein